MGTRNQESIRTGLYMGCLFATLFAVACRVFCWVGWAGLGISAFKIVALLLTAGYLIQIVAFSIRLIHIEGLTLKRIPYVLVLMLMLCLPALARPKLVWSPVDGAVEYVVQWHLDGREQIGALTMDAAALADNDRWVTVGTALGCEYEALKPFGYWRVLARHVDGGLSDPSAVLAVSRPTLQTSIVAMSEMAGGE